MKKVLEEEFYSVINGIDFISVSDIENVSEYYISDDLIGIHVDLSGIGDLFYLAEYLAKN